MFPSLPVFAFALSSIAVSSSLMALSSVDYYMFRVVVSRHYMILVVLHRPTREGYHMIKIEVASEEVTTRQSRKSDPRTNQPYVFHEQEAFAFVAGRDGQPQRYPQRIRITLDDRQDAYKPGLYVLAPESVYVDRFGGLSLGRVVLRPMAAK